MSLFSLKDKSILITGSSKGIGKSIAHQSALMGAKVIISSRKLDACEATAKEINDDIDQQTDLCKKHNNRYEELLEEFLKIEEEINSIPQNIIPSWSFALFYQIGDLAT